MSTPSSVPISLGCGIGGAIKLIGSSIENYGVLDVRGDAAGADSRNLEFVTFAMPAVLVAGEGLRCYQVAH